MKSKVTSTNRSKRETYWQQTSPVKGLYWSYSTQGQVRQIHPNQSISFIAISTELWRREAYGQHTFPSLSRELELELEHLVSCLVTTGKANSPLPINLHHSNQNCVMKKSDMFPMNKMDLKFNKKKFFSCQYNILEIQEKQFDSLLVYLQSMWNRICVKKWIQFLECSWNHKYFGSLTN